MHRKHRRHGCRWRKTLAPDERLLSECHAGDVTCVRRLLNGGPIRHRLLEMGVNPGTEVRVVKYAPLKDPVECVLRGYHIALRVAEAEQVVVSKDKS